MTIIPKPTTTKRESKRVEKKIKALLAKSS